MEHGGFNGTLDRSLDESGWAEDLLMKEYMRHCDNLAADAEADQVVLEEQGRLSGRLVRNIERSWLTELLVRHHTGEIDLEIILDQTRLDATLKKPE